MITLDRQGVRLLLLHEFHLDRSAKEASELINQSMGEGTVSYHTALHWFQKFKSGDYDLNDKPHTGAGSKIDNAHLLSRIEENPSLASRELAEEFGVNHATILRHLHDLGKRWEDGRWVP